MLDLLVGTDTLLWLKSLRDVVSKSYVNTALVVATVLDAAGQTVATVVLDPVSGGHGDYRGTLQDTVNLVDGAKYKVRTVASLGGAVILTLQRDAIAKYYRGLA